MFKFFKPKPVDFAAPFSGTLMTIDQVPDPVFAQKTMGDGFAIDMHDGRVYAPVNGKIVALFPTGHAIGIKSNDRNEYLLHLGLDTVQFKGEGFKVYIEMDQEVEKGDLIAEVDCEFFKSKQVSMVCPILVTNANQRKIKLLKEGQVEAKEEGFLAITA